MATTLDKKLSQLPTATALTGPEKLGGVQDAANVVITAEQIATYAFNLLKDPDPLLSADSDGKFATQRAVKQYIDNLLSAADAMVFKGAIDCSSNPDYPAADAGWTYKVSASGKIGGASGLNVSVGYTFICTTDASPAGDHATVGANWSVLQISDTGSVSGPLSAINGHVAVFDGSSGRVIRDSGLTLAGTNTGDETAASIGLLVVNAGVKTTLATADKFVVSDSADNGVAKAITWQNLQTNIVAVTDARYPLGSGTSTGVNTGDQTNITGNAGTATRLQTARLIDGVSFDGSANISLVAPAIHAATYKLGLVDADEFGIADSEAAFALKRLSYGDMKATIREYLDTIYMPTTSATPNVTFGTTNAEGVATTFLRTDASLAIFNTAAPSTQNYGDAAAVGISNYAARADHKHAFPAAPTGGVPALVFGTVNNAGSSANFLRRDATIAIFDVSAPSALAFGTPSSAGSASTAARRDHSHALPTTMDGVTIGDVTPAAATFTTATATTFVGALSGNANTASKATNLSGGLLGSIPFQSATDTTSLLVPNTSTTKQFLSMTGTGAGGLAPSWSDVSKADVGLGSVENTALSTWAGSANLTTVGTISSGVWAGSVIANDKIPSTLTGKTYNGITLTALVTGFSIAGGSTSSKTLSISSNIGLAGVDGATLNIGSGGQLGTAAFTDVDGYITEAQTFYLGTTQVAVNRASGAMSLAGVSIDGNAATATLAATATNLVGGVLGSIPYQSAPSTTALVSPNITATKQFLSMTGSGAAGAIPAWTALTKADVGLSDVENTALSTWAGSTSITTLGTVATGVWEGTPVDSDKIAAALSGKTYNGLTLTSAATGFTVTGGATPKTLTVSNTLTLVGSDGATLNVGTGGSLGSAAFTSASTYATAAQTFYIGTTQVSINRASGALALTGITSIDGNAATATLASKATDLAGGVLGNVAYQLASDNTVFLAPNTSTSKQFLSMTGTGTVGAAPAWSAITKADVGLSDVENITLSTWAGSSNVTTVGTITTGVWSGTVIANDKIVSALTGKTYNGLTLAANAVGFYLSGGTTSKTLTVSNTLTLAGTDASTLNIGAGGTLGSAAFTPSTNYVLASSKGVANGVASLGADGKVPASQLPAYVDDITEYASLASFPAVGVDGVLYVALDTNKVYRWSGSAYINITSGSVDSVAGKTGVVTLTSSDVGLANVENVALSTWAGSTNLNTVGTITTGTWNGTAIADNKIASALTGKTYNGLALTANATGFSIAGGTVSKTLTVASTLTLQGVDTSVLDIGNGGTLGSAAFTSAGAYATFDQTFYIGTTQIAINRTSGAQTLGVNISGNATTATLSTNLSGGVLGSLHYQSAVNVSAILAPNTSTTKQFLSQTGTGTVGAAPVWATLTKSDVGLANVEDVALSAWVGSASLTTVGTITSGVWEGTSIADGKIASALTGKTYNGLTLTSLTAGFSVAGGTSSKTLTVTNSVTLSGTDGSTLNIGAGGTLGSAAYTNVGAYAAVGQTFYIGTTQVAINRGSAAQTLAGVSIDGNAATATEATNLAGGVLGNLPYQSAVDTTVLLAPNTTTTKQFLSMTGTGVVGAIPAWSVVTKADVGLGSVENTALSTWTGAASISLVGTITTGTWNGTAIADNKIASALTGKTYNSLSLTALATGFTVAGGTASKTLTVSNTVTLAGTDNSTLNIGAGGTLGSAAFTSASSYASVNQAFYLGTTLIPIDRTSGTIALTGITSIDGNAATATTATNAATLIGGVLGSVPYQSGIGVTAFLAPNTTTGRQVLTQTGTGSAGAAPVWYTLDKNDVGLGSVENTALSTWTGSSNVTTVGTIATGIWNAGRVTINTAGSTTLPQLYLSGATNNWMQFVGLGVAAPAYTTRSLGTKIVLYPALSASATDYALGIDTSTLWASVPGIGSSFKWYGGTTLAATLSGAGSLSLTGGISASNLSLGGALTTAGAFSTAGSFSTTLTSTGVTNVTLPTSGTLATTAQTFYMGTTPISISRASGAVSLAGVNIDGNSATSDKTSNLIGGVLGSVPYQIAADTTALLAPNTSLVKQFLSQTGTGTVGAAPAWTALTKSDVGLNLVENTALSTWPGSTNITTLGTIATGTWNGTVIADAKIASALTGKTYNGLTLTSLATGFSVAGGATSKTLTVSNTLTLAGTDGSTLNIASGGTLGTAAFLNVGVASGVASLGTDGKVPTSQLPSYVDAVVEYANLAAFPATGTAGTLYVAQDTSKVYRWSGTQYIDISAGSVDSVAGKTGVVTLVAADVGLGNVENTALSTWIGSTNITTVGTITAGTWSGTAIADNKIASALTGKTYNGLTLTANAVGFSLAGGSTTSKTLTVSNTLTLTGTDGSTLNIGAGGTLGSAAFTASSAYATAAQTFYIGTTQVSVNRASAALALTGITSIDGNAATVTNGVYTTGSYADPAWITSLAKSKVGLGSVENTALSTWAGSSNITTVGTIASGTWAGTVIADDKIASALTGKTYNGLTLTAAVSGFTIAGGTTSKTLTVANTITLAGTDASTLNIGAGGTLGSAAFTNSSAYAAVGQTFYIGTTQVAINRASAALVLTGITSIDGNAATVTNGVYTTGSYADPAWITSLAKSKVGLGSVENTALSTWVGSSNITTLGTIATGTWNGTVIADAKIASALTGKTYNGLTLAAAATGFTIAGGTTSKTLTVANTLTLAGTDASTLNIGAGGTLGSAAFTDAANYAGVAQTFYIGTTQVAINRTSGAQTLSGVSIDGNAATSTQTTHVTGGVLGSVPYQTAVDTTALLAPNTTTSKRFLSQTGTGTVGAAPVWSAVAKADVGLGNVENTALSTWVGSANITTVGTIATGTWNGTVIADAKIASALTGKTYNSLILTANTTGFSVSGGSTTSKTLTVSNSITLAGTDSSTLNIGAGGTLGSAAFTAATAYVATSAVGAASGVASLGADGKVPSAQLPSYVDDVLEYTNLASFPVTGTAGVLYIALDANKVYRWSGTQYVYITSGAVDSVAGKTGVVTLVATDVGLGNVENVALSTWAGSSNITTLGTIATGVWNGTVIADGKIATALTGKTYNGLTLTAAATGFTLAGGTTSKTLTVANTLTLAGTDSSTLNIGAGGTLGTAAFTNASAYATAAQTFYLGTTQIAINRTSGAQTLTGVSIDGNAATVTNGVYTSNYVYVLTGRDDTLNIDTSQMNRFWGSSISNVVGRGTKVADYYFYANLGGNASQGLQLAATYGSADSFYIRRGSDNVSSPNGANAWQPWREILHDSNYTTYTVSKTGTGASGSWGISVTGNAGTATTLQTTRTINGVSFNGSANITITANTTAALLFNSSGTGVASGTTFDGSTARTVSYNTLGAAPLASPAFTGAPTSPTPARDSTSDHIATTLFVRTQFSSTATTGVLDWNDVTNTRPGVGPTLLLAGATNGMGGGGYYHPLTIEYAGTSGANNVTQMAIAYGNAGNELYMRGRYGGAWTSWFRFLNSNNFGLFSPSLGGIGATGTWGISVTGSASGISNTGTVVLGTATESNAITITAPAYTTSQPVKLLNFNWYSDIWSLGNIRSGTSTSEGLGVFFNGAETHRFTSTGMRVAGSTLTLGGNFTTSGASALTLTTTGITNVTLPTSGTLATTSQAFYIGTTAVALNRASGALSLAGVSIDGNAGTVTNGVYTTGSYADPAWITSLAKSKVGLGSVENTALSTWTGSSSITTVGTIGTGVWNGTAIADGKIAAALTGKTYNGLTLTAALSGFTIAGGTTSKTLTVSNTITLAGTDLATLNIGAGGTLGSAAFTASSAYATFNQTFYIGTTQVAINRASAAQTLAGVSIDGNAATVTNGVYTTGTYADPAWITSLAKSKVGLGSVENTALSTWAGSTNITTVGTIAIGTWNGTAIADGKIASALTGKTYNGLTLTANATGFSVAGGTTSKTLTIANTLTFSGNDTATLNIGAGGTLGSAAFTASTAYATAGQTFYIGTTQVAVNRASGAQALTGITSIDGNAATVTNGVYTTGSYADPSWITSLAKSKVGLGNVENTALSTWAGSSNITTVGTLTSLVTQSLQVGTSVVYKTQPYIGNPVIYHETAATLDQIVYQKGMSGTVSSTDLGRTFQLILVQNYDGVTHSSLNPIAVAAANNNLHANVGVSASARGSVINQQKILQINNTDTSLGPNEYANTVQLIDPILGLANAGNTYWQNDWTINSPNTGAEYSLFGTVQMICKWNVNAPTSGQYSVGHLVTTRPKGGAGNQNRAGLTTYPIDVGFAISGFSGVNNTTTLPNAAHANATKGFEIGLLVGGKIGPWLNDGSYSGTSGSKIGTGVYITEHVDYGIRVAGKHAGAAAGCLAILTHADAGMVSFGDAAPDVANRLTVAGHVKIPGTWDGGLMRFGTTNLWWDSSVSLFRYKAGSLPTSTTDGTTLGGSASSSTGDFTVGGNLYVTGTVAGTGLTVNNGAVSIANGGLGANGSIWVTGSYSIYSTTGTLQVGTGSAQSLFLGSNNAQDVTINAAHRVLVGTSTDNGLDKLQVLGSLYTSAGITTGGQIGSDGDIYMNGSRSLYAKNGNLSLGTDTAGFGVSLGIAGAVKVTLSSAGNLLIGTTTDNSSGALQVSGSISMLTQAWNGNRLKLGSYQLWFDASNNLRYKTTNPTSDTDGTLIGGSSGVTSVNASSSVGGLTLSASPTTGAVSISLTGTPTNATNATNATYASYLDNYAGYAYVRALAPSTGSVSYASNSGNSYISLLCTVSGVTTYGNGSYTITIQSTSDRRLKTNIEEEQLGIEFINKLRPRTYYWKDVEGHALDTVTRYHGFIHDEVASVYNPEVKDSLNIVRTGKGEHNGVDYMSLIAPLVKGEQDLYKGQQELFLSHSHLKSEQERLKERILVLEEEVERLRKNTTH